MRKWRIGRFGAWLLLGVLYVLAGADRALAQATGVLTGTVTDGDGVIPGATVTAVDTAHQHHPHGSFQRTGRVPPALDAIGAVHDSGGARRVQADHHPGRGALHGRDAGPRQAGAAGRRAQRDHHRHRGGDAGADHREQHVADRHRGSAHGDPGQGTGHLRHDEDPARHRRHHRQPRLRAVELRPRPQHQRRKLAEQEHDD